MNKMIQRMNKDYNKALKKIANTPIEFDANQKGILCRIETKSGVHIASYTTMVPYVGKLDFKPPMVPLACICGTFVEKPIPSSMFVKFARVGLLKLFGFFFLPYAAMPAFSAKKVYKEKLNWNPLIKRLNQDKKLRDLFKWLPQETKIAVDASILTGKVNYQVFRVDDRDDNYHTVCQVIPFKDKSLVTTRHMMGARALMQISGVKRIEHAVKAISRIREHIIDYGYDQPTYDSIPQPWASIILGFLAPTPTPAPPTSCPSCGAALSPGAAFCPSCGRRVKVAQFYKKELKKPDLKKKEVNNVEIKCALCSKVIARKDTSIADDIRRRGGTVVGSSAALNLRMYKCTMCPACGSAFCLSCQRSSPDPCPKCGKSKLKPGFADLVHKFYKG